MDNPALQLGYKIQNWCRVPWWIDDYQIWEPDLVKCHGECMIYSREQMTRLMKTI
jgi:hypothetical protein